jgi:hypothetical protein
MKGHEHCIAMRSQGLQPDWVFINDFPCQTDWPMFDDFSTVCTVGDNIKHLDMRFLLDCRVSITSLTEKRAKALFEACKPYAKLVASAVVDPKQNPNHQTGWSQTWQK